MDNIIRKGDKVKIIDTGLMFTTYTDWVIKNINNKELLVEYYFGKSFYIDSSHNTEEFNRVYKDEEYTVIKVANHPEQNKKLAYIRRQFGGCFLIDVNGLEKVHDHRYEKES